MKIVWLYEKDHVIHPFIRLAANSLGDAGHDVLVIDKATSLITANYEHRRVAKMFVKFRDRRPASSYKDSHSLENSSSFERNKKQNPAQRLRRFASNGRTWSLISSWVLKFSPDVIITSLPPDLLVGTLVAKVARARLVYYPFELYGEQLVKVPSKWLKIEKWLLRTAVDVVLTQNDKRAEVYLRERQSRVEPIIINNYKASRCVKPEGKLKSLLGVPDGARLALYEGLLTEGRWLAELVRSVKHLPDDVHLGFLGRKHEWWTSEHFDPLLMDPELSRKVSVGPEIPHEDLLSYVADADVGIMIYDNVVRNNYFCAPGKLSDYVLAGVPVVAPNFPTIDPVVRQFNIGRTFTSSRPEEIAKTITEVLNAPAGTWQPGLDRARKCMTWETQVPILLGAVTGCT